METLDLFADKQVSAAAFATAFAGWLASVRRPRKGVTEESSETAYAMMWHSFTEWCVSRGVGLDELTPENLIEFVSRPSQRDAKKDLSPRYVWRLLTLVDRVLGHRSRTLKLPENAAVEEVFSRHPHWRFANADRNDRLPEYLPADAAAKLVAHLSEPRSKGVGEQMPWQEIRNRTSVAVMLGAGLTPGEVRDLELHQVVVAGSLHPGVPWKLQVRGGGAHGMRETPLTGWAGRLLGHYLALRGREKIPGVQLFPSTRKGTAWGKVAQYQATTAVLAAAGIDEGHLSGGSFRLRHTFALRQLRRGKAPNQVALWLGVELREVLRYKSVAYDPDEMPE